MINKIQRFIFNQKKEFADGLKIFFPARTMRESMKKNVDIKHLLVVGLPRSGTSIFQRILNSFPGIFISFESIYSPFIGTNSIKSLHAYYFEVLKQYRHLALINDDLLKKDKIKPFPFDEKYQFFGDKVIYNNSQWFRKRLKKAVESTEIDKIIFIVRDPRDRMNSFFHWNEYRDKYYINTRKNDPQSDLSDVVSKESIKWNDFTEEALHYSGKYEKCLLIRYEDLVNPKAEGINKVIDHLGIPVSDKDLAYYYRSVSKKSIEKWREELDANVSSKIQEVCEKYLLAMNYIE